MSALLDTCVISELRRSHPDRRVVERVALLDPEDAFISVITLSELAKGVALLEPGRRRSGLEAWLAGLERDYAERIVPIDARVARIWGEVTASARQQGVQIPAADGLIAATAIRHGFSLFTRNTRDFAATGARIVDPWEG